MKPRPGYQKFFGTFVGTFDLGDNIANDVQNTKLLYATAVVPFSLIP